MNKLNKLATSFLCWIAVRNESFKSRAEAGPDQGSGTAEAVIITGIFVTIALVVGSLFTHSITTMAEHTANKIMGQ